MYGLILHYLKYNTRIYQIGDADDICIIFLIMNYKIIPEGYFSELLIAIFKKSLILIYFILIVSIIILIISPIKNYGV